MATDPTNRPSWLDQSTDLWVALSQELKILVFVTALAIMAATGYLLASARPSSTSKIALLNGAQFTLQERVEALRGFATVGLSGAEVSGSQILVPADREGDFLRALPASAVPGNLDADLDDYLTNDSWWKSRDESRRQFMMYTSRKVSREIALFPEVMDATVNVTPPPPMGLRRVGDAKASVSVVTVGGQPLSPVRMREIQNLVAHSFNNLQPGNVFVVASSRLESTELGFEGGPINTQLAEMDDRALQIKEMYRKTIEHHLRRALAHLPGATVVANVEVTPTQEIYQKIVTYDKGVPSSTESTTISEETPIAQTAGGPPGTRTNVDAPPTVPNSGVAAIAATATNSDETSSITYNNNMVQTTQRGQDFRPRLVGVVINVPRELLEATTTTDATGQSQAQLPATTEQDIIEAVTRLNYPGLTAELVKVVRMTLPEPLPPVPGPSVVWTITREWGMEIFLGLLALLAVLGAIILGRRAPLPEIVRAIREDESAKEAEEEAAFNALEQDEEANKFTKMQTTVTQIVSSKPEAAAGMIKRWVQQDE